MYHETIVLGVINIINSPTERHQRGPHLPPTVVPRLAELGPAQALQVRAEAVHLLAEARRATAVQHLVRGGTARHGVGVGKTWDTADVFCMGLRGVSDG